MLSHALPGASPWSPLYTCSILVLVHIFNPSFGTQFSSQFWCTPFIWIINVILRPALIPQHSLRSAMPGASPWSPQYTCSIPVMVHMFNLFFLLMFYLNYQSYTLTCTYGMALTALSQLARGKPPGPPSAYTLTCTYAMALAALSQVARGNHHTHA